LEKQTHGRAQMNFFGVAWEDTQRSEEQQADKKQQKEYLRDPAQ
jgi:hypothetical protein